MPSNRYWFIVINYTTPISFNRINQFRVNRKKPSTPRGTCVVRTRLKKYADFCRFNFQLSTRRKPVTTTRRTHENEYARFLEIHVRSLPHAVRHGHLSRRRRRRRRLQSLPFGFPFESLGKKRTSSSPVPVHRDYGLKSPTNELSRGKRFAYVKRRCDGMTPFSYVIGARRYRVPKPLKRRASSSRDVIQIIITSF